MVRGGLQRIWPIVPRIWQETGRNQNSERNQHVPLIDSKALTPAKKKVTYSQPVVDIQPEKDNPSRVRIRRVVIDLITMGKHQQKQRH